MKLVAGVDEAGRGCLAGPVVAAAVVFDEYYFNSDIDDSKQLSAKKREKLFEIIKKEAISYSIVSVGPRRIDKLNILQASLLAMKLAVKRVKADLVLVDGNCKIETHLPQRTIVHGDAISIHIGAASILAKVWRDRLMDSLSEKYTKYRFEKHAGYCTPTHLQALKEHGPCKIHRYSYNQVRACTPANHLPSYIPQQILPFL